MVFIEINQSIFFKNYLVIVYWKQYFPRAFHDRVEVNGILPIILFRHNALGFYVFWLDIIIGNNTKFAFPAYTNPLWMDVELMENVAVFTACELLTPVKEGHRVC